MSRVVLGSYMVRYPLGGMMSWVLQYLIGFQRLGCDVYFVEKSGYRNSCYDPVANVMTDDCTYGAGVVDALLRRVGLADSWCYVDAAGTYHGMDRAAIQSVFDTADVFIDMGTHGAWLEEATRTGLRVLVDGEPGFTQMKMENRLSAGEALPVYDRYYTTGRDIGTGRSTAPTAGLTWHPLFHPVDIASFDVVPIRPRSPFTTVMNWQSYGPVVYRGEAYGHKDVEFAKFIDLPSVTKAPLELAVAGLSVPREELRRAGWHLADAHAVTRSYDSFVEYIRRSGGEFSVCKSGYVRHRTGWFSDRGAAYLASGRPVIQQDTGFGSHLPLGQGLFAAADTTDAARAIDTIGDDSVRHGRWAREIAAEYLDAPKVLRGFLDELGTDDATNDVATN